MSEGTKITLAGDWGKPAETLITKVSDAIGAGFRPHQIRRVAKAEADAKIIAAEAEQKCRDLVLAAQMEPTDAAIRAMRRMVGEEIKKQENIENIVRMAAERLREDAEPNEIEDDFVSDLFEKAKNTSNPEMQSLWASLLAGEADRPGRFSKRTVAAVSALDKRDAELFTKFCSCCWMLGLTLTPLLTPRTQEVFKSRGIGFTELTHLDAIGLVHFDNITGFQQLAEGKETPMEFSLFYFGVPMRVSIQHGPTSFEIGNALLTNVGRELAEISGASFDEELRDAAISDIVNNARGMYCVYSGRENPDTT